MCVGNKSDSLPYLTLKVEERGPGSLERQDAGPPGAVSCGLDGVARDVGRQASGSLDWEVLGPRGVQLEWRTRQSKVYGT